MQVQRHPLLRPPRNLLIRPTRLSDHSTEPAHKWSWRLHARRG